MLKKQSIRANRVQQNKFYNSQIRDKNLIPARPVPPDTQSHHSHGREQNPDQCHTSRESSRQSPHG